MTRKRLKKAEASAAQLDAADDTDSSAALPPPVLEPRDDGIVVHFDRMQAGSFVGGAWPTIEECGRCNRTGARVGASTWMHVGIMRLGSDNEPRIVSLKSCGNVNRNGVGATGLKSARARVDNEADDGVGL